MEDRFFLLKGDGIKGKVVKLLKSCFKRSLEFAQGTPAWDKPWQRFITQEN